MYLLIPLQSSLSYCAKRLWRQSRQRGKSHPLIGWDANAQASLLHFYSMVIKRSVPFEKIIF